MLCGCGKPQAADTASLYQYSTDNSRPQQAPHSHCRKGGPEIKTPSRIAPPSGDRYSQGSEVLLADESYPGRTTPGAWNPGFDSGIESGTVTLDSCNQSLDGVHSTPHGSDTLARMRKYLPVPLLEFNEKGKEQRISFGRTIDAYTSCSTLHNNSKMYQPYQGQLKVAVYLNYGLLTVHIMEGRQLLSKSSEECNSYVKVSIMPDGLRRTKCRTDVINACQEPKYEEKFSFELLDEDVNKRVLISVWNRSHRQQTSELLGCMSFGIQHILEEKTMANGWYFLLSEHLGRRKHLHVHNKRRPIAGSLNASSCTSILTSPFSERTSDYAPSFCGPISTVTMLRDSPSVSYGITLTGGSPASVFTIETGSPADMSGLTTSHKLLKVEGQDVSRATADTVARIIRFCERQLTLEVHQCKGQTCMFEESPGSSTTSEDTTPLSELPRQSTIGYVSRNDRRHQWLCPHDGVLSQYSEDGSTTT